MKRFECWDAGDGLLYLFTKDRDIAMILRKEFKKFTVYWINNVQVSWQFLVPGRIIGILEQKLKSAGSDDNRTVGINNHENSDYEMQSHKREMY